MTEDTNLKDILSGNTMIKYDLETGGINMKVTQRQFVLLAGLLSHVKLGSNNSDTDELFNLLTEILDRSAPGADMIDAIDDAMDCIKLWHDSNGDWHLEIKE